MTSENQTQQGYKANYFIDIIINIDKEYIYFTFKKVLVYI